MFMKKIYIIFLLLLQTQVFAQTITWSAAVPVAGSPYSNLHPRIAVDRNGNPLVLWGNSGSSKAYFSRWNGAAFTTPLQVNPGGVDIFAASWSGPDIASHGDTVYIVYKRIPEMDTNNHIYTVTSVNGGMNFSAPVRVDYVADTISRFPVVTTTDNGNPVVAFMKVDPSMGNARYVVSQSSDFGNSFAPDVLASGTTGEVCDCCPASVLSSGTNRVMLYRNNLANIRDTWAGVSTNNGMSFSNTLSIDGNNWMIMSCPSTGPDGIIVGDTVYSVFMNQGGGSARVYNSKFSISSGLGVTSSLLTGSITGLTQQNYPSMAKAGNAAVVVWKQVVSGNSQIALSFTKTITTGFPSTPETIATGFISNADVAMTPTTIHVVWQDDNTGTVMYRKGIYAVSVEELLTAGNYMPVYPNPATNAFSVLLKDSSNITTCTLIDHMGKHIPINTSRSNNTMHIAVDGLANGQYYVLLSDNSGNKYYSKLTVQNK